MSFWEGARQRVRIFADGVTQACGAEVRQVSTSGREVKGTSWGRARED